MKDSEINRPVQYLGSYISSTKSNDNVRTGKVLTAIEWLSIIRKSKSNLSDKIKWDSSNLYPCLYYYMAAPSEL